MKTFKHIGKPIPRVDARAKTMGELKYPSDLYPEGFIWLKVLRAAHPHALIKNIDTSIAEKVEGVVKILTHRDIPGENVKPSSAIEIGTKKIVTIPIRKKP